MNHEATMPLKIRIRIAGENPLEMPYDLIVDGLHFRGTYKKSELQEAQAQAKRLDGVIRNYGVFVKKFNALTRGVEPQDWNTIDGGYSVWV